jgi:cyclophilin family peptidyl-prolyl cis-trans isomerase
MKNPIFITLTAAVLTLGACTPPVEVELNSEIDTLSIEGDYSENSTGEDGLGTEAETPEITINNDTMQTKPQKGQTIATLKTNKGDIKMLLYTEKVPETTKNFIELAKADKYDGVIFHRVINDFMIQTGDFENGDGTGGYSYKGEGTLLKDEFDDSLEHVAGAVSMANRGPNTGGSQFFIVQAEAGTPWLDGGHAIFGYVYEGMDVVNTIAGAEKDMMDRPLDDIVIEDVIVGEY